MRFRSPELEGVSSHNQTLGCPQCQRRMELVGLRDGEQAYWCHTCQRGWRAGHLPPESRLKRSKVDSGDADSSDADSSDADSSDADSVQDALPVMDQASRRGAQQPAPPEPQQGVQRHSSPRTKPSRRAA